MYLSVSASSAVGAAGKIGVDKDFERTQVSSADPTSYSVTPTNYTFDGYFLHTPGTYYWQASYFACDSTTYVCADQVSPVMTINVAAPPPAATPIHQRT